MEENRKGASSLNSSQAHLFNDGWSTDLDGHIKEKSSYSDSWNGRLYVDNGTLCFTSISGTRKVYENPNVVNYLGWYSFNDELIVFAKGNFPLTGMETQDKIINEVLVNSFSVGSNTNTITGIPFSTNFEMVETIIQVPVETLNEDDFEQNLTNVENGGTVDSEFNGLFKSVPYLPVTECSIFSNEEINNPPGLNDAIISFKYNESNMLVASFMYVGKLNFPLNGVITTEGVDENSFYKRVYFSDYYNPSRTLNLKDSKLKERTPKEFEINTNGILLNPRINKINTNGQLKAMTVFYAMKLITDNGQSTDFSALSKGVKITSNGKDFLYSGGDVKEVTDKSVVVDCYIPNYKSFKEVVLIAIEFQAPNVPTQISLVGRKSVSELVSFEHFGSEIPYTENITLSDIFANSISWRYNSDYTTKNNKLIVSGLRNDPLSITSNNIALDFSLRGYSDTGETHDCLLNPDPVKYNYINNAATESFSFVLKKLYKRIDVFGNFKMKLINNKTGEFYEFVQPDIIYDYVDYIDPIGAFLLGLENHWDFAIKFPNLTFVKYDDKIVFNPIDETLKTDFYYYNLEFSTSQVILEVNNATENLVQNWPTSINEKNQSLVYGGISNGWFNGNGIKVTMHTELDNVLSKNTDWMNNSKVPLQIKEPTLKKGFMKGEIYRLGIQWYKNGNRLFTTVLGDIKIPDIGQVKRELTLSGQVAFSESSVYKNWSVVDNEMYAERVTLQFDVRINCQLSKEVDAYQIVYVERDENNRTILAQGLTAPTERIMPFNGTGDYSVVMAEIVENKWGLPVTGGPVYDYSGLGVYDANPDKNTVDAHFRIVTNRKLFSFDSPDFIYDKISTKLLESSRVDYVETLATDHDRHNILGGYNLDTCGYGDGDPGACAYNANGTFTDYGPSAFGAPKFSQKIPNDCLAGEEKERAFFVNVSVFSSLLKRRNFDSFQNIIKPEFKNEIDVAQDVPGGAVFSGYKFNEAFDVSNNAFTLATPNWYYQINARPNGGDMDKYSLFRVNNVAAGRRSVFIKTKENFFSNNNIAQNAYLIKGRVNFGTSSGRRDELYGHDAYIIANLKREIADSIYGGRSEYAYSNNVYIPLGDCIPVNQTRVTSQITYVEGDSYCTLYLRNKTSYGNSMTPTSQTFHWSRESSERNQKHQYNKRNAWCYAVVLESTMEPRLNNSEEFYKFSKSINFNYTELYNPAYLQENNLRKSIPVPFNFKDDPILNNVIAASKVKLNGDFVDSWSEFQTNEFYELDKNKGTVFNLVKEKDEIFAVQEEQTSQVKIDENTFITPDNGGSAIQVAQGSGKSISAHIIVSDYGTSNRRAVIENPFGFVFYDERKHEMLKIIEPLFLKNNLLLHIKSLFENNLVTGVQGYYDEKYKETNIRIRTKENVNFVISYNEILKVFNGKYEYDNDLYFQFQNKVIAPYANCQKLGELNTGNELEIFEQNKDLVLEVFSNPMPLDVKINKGIAVNINTSYPIKKTIFKTSLNQVREILGTHHWYKVREGLHTLPAKNEMDLDNIWGEYCSIRVETDSQANNKINIFSLTNFYRKSYK